MANNVETDKGYSPRKAGQIKYLLSPAGVGIIIVCFFLPWIKFSCSGQSKYMSGANLGGIFWIVFLAAMIVGLALLYFWNKGQLHKAKPWSLYGSLAGLAILLFKYLQFAWSDKYGVGAHELGFSIQVGSIGTAIGLGMILSGALLLKPEDTIKPVAKRKQSEIIALGALTLGMLTAIILCIIKAEKMGSSIWEPIAIFYPLCSFPVLFGAFVGDLIDDHQIRKAGKS